MSSPLVTLNGPGSVREVILNGKLLFQYLSFNHHFRMTRGGIVVDGVVFKHFQPNDVWSCEFDEFDETEEMSLSN